MQRFEPTPGLAEVEKRSLTCKFERKDTGGEWRCDGYNPARAVNLPRPISLHKMPTGMRFEFTKAVTCAEADRIDRGLAELNCAEPEEKAIQLKHYGRVTLTRFDPKLYDPQVDKLSNILRQFGAGRENIGTLELGIGALEDMVRAGLMERTELVPEPITEAGMEMPRAAYTISTLHNLGLGTELKRTFGKEPPEWARRLIRRLGVPYEEVARRKAFIEMSKIAAHFDLSKPVREEMMYAYTKLAKEDFVGVSLRDVFFDLTYLATRKLGQPRSIEELRRGFKELGHDVREDWSRTAERGRKLGYSLIPASPHDYIDRYATIVGRPEAARKAHEIVDKVGATSPHVKAATAVWLASGLPARKISEKLGITPPQLSLAARGVPRAFLKGASSRSRK